MVRTECMICDGCGKHEQINQSDFRNAVYKMTDYIPDKWVLMKDGPTNVKAYHDILCAYQAMFKPEQGSAFTVTQLAMFEGESSEE